MPPPYILSVSTNAEFPVMMQSVAYVFPSSEKNPAPANDDLFLVISHLVIDSLPFCMYTPPPSDALSEPTSVARLLLMIQSVITAVAGSLSSAKIRTPPPLLSLSLSSIVTPFKLNSAASSVNTPPPPPLAVLLLINPPFIVNELPLPV